MQRYAASATSARPSPPFRTIPNHRRDGRWSVGYASTVVCDLGYTRFSPAQNKKNSATRPQPSPAKRMYVIEHHLLTPATRETGGRTKFVTGVSAWYHIYPTGHTQEG